MSFAIYDLSRLLCWFSLTCKPFNDVKTHLWEASVCISTHTCVNLIRQENNKDSWDLWKVWELWKHCILSFSKHSLETNLKIVSLLTFCTDKEILLTHHISRVHFWLWWERKNHERPLCVNVWMRVEHCSDVLGLSRNTFLHVSNLQVWKVFPMHIY